MATITLADIRAAFEEQQAENKEVLRKLEICLKHLTSASFKLDKVWQAVQGTLPRLEGERFQAAQEAIAYTHSTIHEIWEGQP